MAWPREPVNLTSALHWVSQERERDSETPVSAQALLFHAHWFCAGLEQDPST